MLESVLLTCFSYSEVARALGASPHGSVSNNLKKRITEFGLDTSHFTRVGRNWLKGKERSELKRSASEILVCRDKSKYREHAYLLRRAMLEVCIPHMCEICGLGSEWNGKSLLLEIDHIDGQPWNNVQENLRFLCPNCHTQTGTHRNKKRDLER
jgi:5-methylcytosine-specific restriction endonuclease McrA